MKTMIKFMPKVESAGILEQDKKNQMEQELNIILKDI